MLPLRPLVDAVINARTKVANIILCERVALSDEVRNAYDALICAREALDEKAKEEKARADQRRQSGAAGPGRFRS